jgi:hypothetical protein
VPSVKRHGLSTHAPLKMAIFYMTIESAKYLGPINGVNDTDGQLMPPSKWLYFKITIEIAKPGVSRSNRTY